MRSRNKSPRPAQHLVHAKHDFAKSAVRGTVCLHIFSVGVNSWLKRTPRVSGMLRYRVKCIWCMKARVYKKFGTGNHADKNIEGRCRFMGWTNTKCVEHAMINGGIVLSGLCVHNICPTILVRSSAWDFSFGEVLCISFDLIDFWICWCMHAALWDMCFTSVDTYLHMLRYCS